jgi:SAM-dependent methyltransferase
MKYFSENEIYNVFYNKVKHDDSYYKKYEKLPKCPIKSWNYSWQNFDFPRCWCVLDFKEWIEKYKINVETLGYTCDTDPELEFIQYKNKQLLDYPTFDLHTINNFFDNYFDFFLFNQTLEHLYNPFMAVESIYKVIKPGGYVFTSVPTINIPHSTPIHYNGFTPMGLATLFMSAGFEILEIGQWGNFEYINKLWSTHSWPGFEMLNHNGSVINEENNVCQCWILAKKP